MTPLTLHRTSSSQNKFALHWCSWHPARLSFPLLISPYHLYGSLRCSQKYALGTQVQRQMGGRYHQKGFTLIEMLLSVAIIGILVAGSAPIFNSFVARNDLDVVGQQVASALRRAQTYARGMDDDSAWSVNVASTAVTLYKGTVFVSRDTAYDEVVSIPPTITVSGLSDVQFAKFTASPNTTGSITLTSNANDTRTLTINAKGMVEY